MKKSLLMLSLIATTAFSALGQTVTGRVTSGTDDNPLPGVSVLIKGTTIGTATDAEGNYTLSVNGQDNAVLSFSFIGFKTQEVPLAGRSVVDIAMQEDIASLNEVVVTAFGLENQDRKLGYAVTKVDVAEIERTNTISPITALQGKVAGLNINVVGAAGVQTSPSVMIRGAKSLRQDKNQAIFVIDGMVIENNTMDADGVDVGSQLKNLNPNDFESITVLKGASATSLYGSRGANGAIVITTKKGKAGKGLGISYSTTYQVEKIYENGLPLQDVYGMGSAFIREGNFKPDGTQTYTSYSFGPKMDGRLMPALYDPNTKVPYTPQPDNWKSFYQDGRYVNNNIALSGGSDRFTYRLSYTNLRNDGVLPNNAVNRNNFDLRATGQLNKIFSLELGASYAMTEAKNFYGQGRYYWTGGENLGFLTYYSVPRNADMKAWKENYRNPDGSMKSYGYSQWDGVVNQAFNRFDNRDNTRNERSLLTNILLKAQVTDWLDVSAKANFNNYSIFNEDKERGGGAFGAGGYYGVGGNYTSAYNYLFMVHGNRQIANDLNLDFAVLNEYYGNGRTESYSASTSGGLIVPNVFTLNNSVNNIQNNLRYGYETPNSKVVGLGARVLLGYKDYLNLELTARQDWMSSLTYPKSVPGGNNFGVFYPSASASWAFSEMFATAMPSWLSFGNLRASLAWVGNGTSTYATSFGSYRQEAILGPDGQSVTKAYMDNASVLPNLDLKPEKQRSIEVGSHLTFINDRLDLDVAWYRTNTFNQILTIPGTIETGYAQRRINAGNIQNQGVELSLNVMAVNQSDLTWDVSFNYSRNRGKILEFYPGIDEYVLMGEYDGVLVIAKEGGAFGTLVAGSSSGWTIAERDPATGYRLIQFAGRQTSTDPETKSDFQLYDYVYADIDPENRPVLGNVQPDFIGGVNTTVRWKNLSLYAQVDSRFGGVAYSEAYNYGMGRGNVLNSLKYRDQEHGGVARTDSYSEQTVYDGVIPDAVFAEGQVSPVDGTDLGGMTFREAYEQGLVEAWKAGAYYPYVYGWGGNVDSEATTEVSWVMLREISLGYRLPNSIVEKVRLNSANVRFTARNIGYLYNGLTGGQNPASLQSNNPFMPMITGAVPFSRNFALSLNITL